MLKPGDLVPHFTVVTVGGPRMSYRDIWQRRNLLLVTIVPGDEYDDYAGAIQAMESAFAEQETALVITAQSIAGVPTPGALIADRWGEVFAVHAFQSAADAPAPTELLATVTHVRMKCPECEGEAR